MTLNFQIWQQIDWRRVLSAHSKQRPEKLS